MTDPSTTHEPLQVALYEGCSRDEERECVVKLMVQKANTQVSLGGCGPGSGTAEQIIRDGGQKPQERRLPRLTFEVHIRMPCTSLGRAKGFPVFKANVRKRRTGGLSRNP